MEYDKYELLFLKAQAAAGEFDSDKRAGLTAAGCVLHTFCVDLEKGLAERRAGKPEDTFDTRVCKMISEAVGAAFNVPELRSVAVVFDWVGDLNQGAATYLWYDKAGTINPGNREAICGSIGQTAKLLEIQTLLAHQMAALIDETVRERLDIIQSIKDKERVNARGNEEAEADRGGESHQDDRESATAPGN